MRFELCKHFLLVSGGQESMHPKLLIIRNSGLGIAVQYLYLNFHTAGSSKSSISSIKPSLSSKIGRLGSASFYKIQKPIRLQSRLASHSLCYITAMVCAGNINDIAYTE
jgi:hypothetical protein